MSSDGCREKGTGTKWGTKSLKATNPARFCNYAVHDTDGREAGGVPMRRSALTHPLEASELIKPGSDGKSFLLALRLNPVYCRQRSMLTSRLSPQSTMWPQDASVSACLVQQLVSRCLKAVWSWQGRWNVACYDSIEGLSRTPAGPNTDASLGRPSLNSISMILLLVRLPVFAFELAIL